MDETRGLEGVVLETHAAGRLFTGLFPGKECNRHFQLKCFGISRSQAAETVSLGHPPILLFTLSDDATSCFCSWPVLTEV